ncbi:hypothetical protein KR067_007021 [Drosophila pandora]|nr:hypothetical protein KR067_007021 [Drosophila pandora]
MIGERQKSRDLVTILGLLPLLLPLLGLGLGLASGQVVEVLAQSQSPATTASTVAPATERQTVAETKTNASQDEVPATTVRSRLDPNNNNEWRPLGHGDPLQKDPTYDYSPPALERVRYWAENNSTGQSNPEARKKELPPEVLRNKTKSEILVLGQASERVRTAHSHSHSHPHPHQYPSYNQQAKYAAIRRSYYAPTQQHLHQQSQHMPPTHLMPPPPMMMVKSSGSGMPHMEYRHSMMATGSPTSYMSYMSSPPPKQSMTSSVIYHQPTMMHHHASSSPPASTPWHPSSMSSIPPHRLSYPDPHHQETMQTYSFSRPNHHQSVSYSPNSLPGHQVGQGGSKASGAVRKPWLHELLQKEVVLNSNKPKVKPTMPATKYLMGTTKPHHSLPPAGFGISSTRPPFTYAPVTFVPGPPTIAVPTVATLVQQPEIFITPTPQTSSSGFRPMLMTSSSTTVTVPSTTPTALPIYQRTTTSSAGSTTSNRLLIPQTSNLAKRPTVAPAPSPNEATTDSLFSHYKQPAKPLLGPMYLIIEGHSKVKTYGQNEFDPHSPKLVPVISKREPVVRIADPNEKRGTVESYQVKHLHTKTTPMTTTTTTERTTSTTKVTTTKGTTKVPTKPTQKTPDSTTLKDIITGPTLPTITKPTEATKTTQSPPKLSVSTKTPLAQPLPKVESPPSGVKDLLSLLDNMFADAHEIASSASPSPQVSSSTMGTILKPISTKLLPQQPEPRIGSKGAGIESLLTDGDDDDEAAGESGSAISTETPPRATRQVFDYDQLPESRIKEGVTDSDIMEYNDGDDEEEDEDNPEENDDNETATDDQLEEDETEDEEHNLLKRIDQFVDDVDDVDDGDDDLEDLIEDLGRKQH